ncbi:MAG: MmcQ/YjbR family DNA-binding protein [Campylobacter sp.]|nr:MmcQ/YjbR family DNA-binding protein [Campylobacter sp.]
MAKFKDFDELNEFIFDKYGVKCEFLWEKYPEFGVFRHESKGKKSGKWFCLFMQIPQNSLGVIGNKTISVINLKCNPELAVILHDNKGIFPAYHMNKKHWISVILDAVPKSQVADLIEESWNLTR